MESMLLKVCEPFPTLVIDYGSKTIAVLYATHNTPVFILIYVAENFNFRNFCKVCYSKNSAGLYDNAENANYVIFVGVLVVCLRSVSDVTVVLCCEMSAITFAHYSIAC
jgi:hypothetical protein